MSNVDPYHSTMFPAQCAHGMAWALPCAACGRPYQPPAQISVDGGAELGRLLALLERIAVALEKRP